MLSDSELDQIWKETGTESTLEVLRAVANAAAKNALLDAAETYSTGQLTGVFLSSVGYTQAWLRACAASIPTTTKENER